MAPSGDESDLSESRTTISTPFSIAARTTASSKPPAKATRNIRSRRPIVPSIPRKSRKKRPATAVSRALDDHILLVTIPTDPIESPDKESETSSSYTLSDQRNSLEAKTIKLLECMKSWFRLGIFTEEDLHAIVSTMEEGALEALEL